MVHVSPAYLLKWSQNIFELQCLEVTVGLWYQSLVNSDIYCIDFRVNEEESSPHQMSVMRVHEKKKKNLLGKTAMRQTLERSRPENKFPACSFPAVIRVVFGDARATAPTHC